jgi:hypothetical protein
MPVTGAGAASPVYRMSWRVWMVENKKDLGDYKDYILDWLTGETVGQESLGQCRFGFLDKRIDAVLDVLHGDENTEEVETLAPRVKTVND